MNARLIRFALVATAVVYIGVARTHLMTAAPSLATSAALPAVPAPGAGAVAAVTPYASAGRLARGPLAGAAGDLNAPRGSLARLKADRTAPISLASALDVAITDQEVHFHLTVTNTGGRKVELRFPSGQAYDVVVFDASGSEVWRWSTGQMFTQSLHNKPLDAKETLSYTAQWRHPVIHGALVAVATLTSTNYPSTARADFALP